MTPVQPEELLVAIRIPKEWAGARFYFEKVTDRERLGLRRWSMSPRRSDRRRRRRAERRAWPSAACRCTPRRSASPRRPSRARRSIRSWRQARRPVRDPRRASAQLQPLQGAADGEPRHALGARRHGLSAGAVVPLRHQCLRADSAGGSVVGSDLVVRRCGAGLYCRACGGEGPCRVAHAVAGVTA